MAEAKEVGYRVKGTIKAVKGTIKAVKGTIKAVKGICNAGHKVGDVIDLSGRNTGGMCGYFYHSIFPYVIMLQFGGGFPAEWGDPDVVELDCMDKINAVTIELRRIAETK